MSLETTTAMAIVWDPAVLLLLVLVLFPGLLKAVVFAISAVASALWKVVVGRMDGGQTGRKDANEFGPPACSMPCSSNSTSSVTLLGHVTMAIGTEEW